MIIGFRPATHNDIPAIMTLIRGAQESLRKRGIDQWQNGYPNEQVISEDIIRKHSYVWEKASGIIATVMISFDGEPTYKQIDGDWLTTGPYAVIHRLTVLESCKGQNIAGQLIEEVGRMCIAQNIPSIRIDTHKQNISMQRAAVKAGFTYCGVITLNDGALRLAYEKIIV